MRSVVVSDQKPRLVLGRFAVNFFQELQLLGVGLPLLTLADLLTFEHGECGK